MTLASCKTDFDKLKTELQELLNHWLRPSPPLVFSNYPFIYTVLLFTNKDILLALDDSILRLLFCTFSKYKIIEVIEASINKKLNKKLTIPELVKNYILELQQNCQASNFFIQDIFRPEAIFKHSYFERSFIDIFTTSFYYLMNCTYSTHTIPLNKNHSQPKVKFPLDISTLEWQRPTIIVDVANEFKSKGDYNQREGFLFINIDSILEKLFKKNDDPRIMVIFVNQSNLSANTNCPEIYNFKSATNEHLIDGTPERPFNRVVLYLTVPCNIFQYPELNLPEYTQLLHPYYFNYGAQPIIGGYGTEPLYTNGVPYNYQTSVRRVEPFLSKQKHKSVAYDEYGRMLKVRRNYPYYNMDDHAKITNEQYRFLDVNRRIKKQNVRIPEFDPYQQATSADHFKPKYPTAPKSNRSNRHGPNGPLIQGQNINQRFVERNSACAKKGNMGKNEVDDYMIAILLLCHFKSMMECPKYTPFTYQWILFSNDGYNWMNRDLLTDVVHVRNSFFRYIDDDSLPPIPMIVSNPLATEIIQKCGLWAIDKNSENYKQLHEGIIWMNRKLNYLTLPDDA